MLANEAQVVRNEQNAHISFTGKFFELLENFCLGRYIKGGGRFIGD
jgi:hypothetical protein